MAEKATGKVIRILAEKRFGFIKDDASGYEYFFHSSALPHGEFEVLTEGAKVTFDTGQGPKGPRAENVRRTD